MYRGGKVQNVLMNRKDFGESEHCFVVWHDRESSLKLRVILTLACLSSQT
jgi:hypothetical protein